MKTFEIKKTFWDGQKYTEFGFFSSVESAHASHKHYCHQQDLKTILTMGADIPFIILAEYVDGKHRDESYFTWVEI